MSTLSDQQTSINDVAHNVVCIWIHCIGRENIRSLYGCLRYVSLFVYLCVRVLGNSIDCVVVVFSCLCFQCAAVSLVVLLLSLINPHEIKKSLNSCFFSHDIIGRRM